MATSHDFNEHRYFHSRKGFFTAHFGVSTLSTCSLRNPISQSCSLIFQEPEEKKERHEVHTMEQASPPHHFHIASGNLLIWVQAPWMSKCWGQLMECNSTVLYVLLCSVMSDSFQPQGPQPTRFLCPCNFPGKNTGVGCHFLLQGSSQPKDGTLVSYGSCIGRQVLYLLSYWEVKVLCSCLSILPQNYSQYKLF